MSEHPSVAVLVLNRNGREHLETCLASLEAQTYPRDRVVIEVVDNGSTDDSLAYVREHFPRVRIRDLKINHGFAEAYNIAVRGADTDFVALLNNDTRVDERWLTELVSAAERHGAAAVASKIVDWTGERIDFVGGLVTVIGHAWQRDFGEPDTRAYGEDRLLFPCAGSALYRRAAFLDAGGFDRNFFAYFEDVDLGWRLALFGQTTVLAPAAVTYHRLHGSFSRLAYTQRLRLFERNALAMIYKNYEAATLNRVLPAAIALSLMRGLIGSGIESLTLPISEPPPPVVHVSRRLVAHLIALEDFCRQLPDLHAERTRIQSRRCRSDAEIFELFGGQPFKLHEPGGPYEEVARALIHDFELEELVSPAHRAPLPSASLTPVDHVHPVPFAIPETAPVSRPAFAVVLPPALAFPKVSIIILTALGATHLRECLASLREQTYPGSRFEVLVVDNASAHDPTAEIAAAFPRARVIRNATNLGFSAGNNIGARAATGDYVVFLNDDTRVEPDWLRELVGTARRRGAAAVASCLVDWEGRTIDFIAGAVNFEGKGFQIDYGQPAHTRNRDERPLLFACGGAMLIDRAIFSDAGELDEGAFAYYEDVELGWRLRVLGHDVWSSPHALVHHKHHGTSGRWAEPPRVRLYERNSLRMLYSVLERDSLARTLPAALLLAVDRALLHTGISRAADESEVEPAVPRRSTPTVAGVKASGRAALGRRGITRHMSLREIGRRLGFGGLVNVARESVSASTHPALADGQRTPYLIERGIVPAAFDAEPEPLPIAAGATLSGIYGFLADLPRLSARRAAIQERRRRSDAEILEPFSTHWLAPCGAPNRNQLLHNALHETLVKLFAIARVVEPDGAGVNTVREEAT